MSNYYVSGCVADGDDVSICDDSVAQFWTLYHRNEEGLSEGIIDCMFREDAETAMRAYEERDALAAKVKQLEWDSVFIPKNLDQALTVMGVSLPVSKEEFNFEINRWIQRLVDRVIRNEPDFSAYANQLRAEGIPGQLKEIGELIRTQDNRITDQPMFVVFEEREIIGSDEHSPSRIVWVWEGEDVDELRGKRLELLYQNGRDTRGYDRYAMQEIDVFVTACFTEQGCKDYLRKNGHNLRHPYIYAAGSYRNDEYQAVRNWLESLPQILAANLSKENGNG